MQGSPSLRRQRSAAVSLRRRYGQLTLWNKIAFWGSVASVVGLLLGIAQYWPNESLPLVENYLRFDGAYVGTLERGFQQYSTSSVEEPTKIFMRFYRDGVVTIVEDQAGYDFTSDYAAVILHREVGGEDPRGVANAKWFSDTFPQRYGVSGPSIRIEMAESIPWTIFATVYTDHLELIRFYGAVGARVKVAVPGGTAIFKRMEFKVPS